MKKLFTFAIVFSLSMLLATTAFAVGLELSTSTPTVITGSTFDVDLSVTGADPVLGVGEFDVDITYDTSLMSFSGYSLGTGLGDVSLFEALDFSAGDLGGTIDLAEVSLLFFLPIQPPEFSLATLTFQCLGVGTSDIAIDYSDPLLAVGDALGNPYQIVRSAPLTITQTPVPEPGTFLLLGAGLIGLITVRRRTKK